MIFLCVNASEGGKKKKKNKRDKDQFLVKLRKGRKQINTQPAHAEQNLIERYTSFKGLVKGRVMILTVRLEKRRNVDSTLEQESRSSSDQAG